MFKNKVTVKHKVRNNLVGEKISKLRKQENISQRILSERLEDFGISIDKNAVQRIESGQRFVTDIELAAFAAYFSIEITDLFF